MSDNEEDTTESSIQSPVPTSRVSLPVRFANPENPKSERPIALLSSEILIGQTKQLVDNNESLLTNISQTLVEVDKTLSLTDSIMNNDILNQTIEPNEGGNHTLLEPSKIAGSSSSENVQKLTQITESLSTSDRTVDTIGLEAALKLLPSTFSGINQEDLEVFLEQCEFAIMCANDRAKPRLLQGIMIRLTNKARAAIKFRTINTWNELKETLKNSLEPKRTTTHLYLELYSSKQRPNEDVASYSSRIESLQTLILEQETSGKTLEAATALENSLKAQTIQVFIEGLGNLKDFIKARNPPTLDKAIQAAREEERVRKSLEESKRFYEVPNKQHNGKTPNKKPSTPCFHCGKMGHWARDCRSQQSTSNSGNSTNHPPKVTVNTITCRYCKKPGHTKEVCRKLKYVNSKKGIETSENGSKNQGNQSQSDINGGRPASSIKTAAVSFQNSS